MHILEALRTGTALLHEQLDQSFSGQAIVTRGGYERFLLMQASVVPQAEDWLSGQAAFATLPQSGERMRAAALQEDLEKLNLTVPHAPDMSFLNDECSVIGVSYVLEGSRLGAAYLCSLLDNSDTGFPTAFLRHGQGRGFWKTFLTWLPKQDTTRAPAAVRSAQQMFEAYLNALTIYDDRNHVLEQC